MLLKTKFIMFKFLIIVFCLLPLIRSTFVEYGYGNIPQEAPKLTAVEAMVDVANDLSYKILHQHSIANRNNFAFSPTTLASVLIALYEGNQGIGATEIYNVLKLPWNRDILRIGYRDIHRRLRTYLFDGENPLTGLSLSKENVTITTQYEDILKFYGYDLGADMISSMEDDDVKKNMTISIEPTLTLTTTSEIPLNTQFESSSITSIADEGITPTSSSTSSTPEPTTTTSTAQEPTTPFTTAREPTTPTTTTQEPTTPTTATQEPTTPTTTTQEPTTPTTTTQEPTLPTTSTQEPTTSALPTAKDTESSSLSTEVGSTITATTPVEDSTTESSTLMNEDESTTAEMLITTTISPLKQISTIDPSTVIFPSKRLIRPSTNRRARTEGRIKRQYPLAFDDQPPFTLTVTPIHQYPNFDFVSLDNDEIYNNFYRTKTVTSKKDIHHVFYLNAHETIQTSYKVYNSILRFNYIENIRSSVLELELDTKDYDLLIMIPDYGFGLDFLLQALKLAPTLRIIRQEMKPRWVQAIIPDFKLKGNIFLTNDLQNLGILEIFEPSQADFSPMTNETDIYVKHIEQSINVHLRTRPIDQLKRNIGPFNRPIEVSVNHPFLFFIVDKELDLATMAGRVINPLNVRIH